MISEQKQSCPKGSRIIYPRCEVRRQGVLGQPTLTRFFQNESKGKSSQIKKKTKLPQPNKRATTEKNKPYSSQAFSYDPKQDKDVCSHQHIQHYTRSSRQELYKKKKKSNNSNKNK